MAGKSHLCVWLAALLAAAACGDSDTVSISGAVARPGSFPHRADWRASDYVGAAGGYLQDADLPEAAIVRLIPDTTDVPERGMLVSRLPLDDSQDVLPGDEIFVPKLRFLVRMDTVRAVDSLVLAWQDRLYRVPSGRLVPGWTDRGPVAAIVIGDGDVVAQADSAFIGRFHYLYIRTDPKAYPQRVKGIGPCVREVEVLEDAGELHRMMCKRLDMTEDDAVEIPAQGTFRVVAGIWPKPRSVIMPGSGIRKRRYADGREWTSYGDGRRRVKHPDGLVVVNYPDGGKEVRRPNGMRVMKTATGIEETVFPDGKVEITYPDGNQETRYPDGRLEQRFASGTVRTTLPGGEEQTAFADGTVEVRQEDGHTEISGPEGTREVRYADGRKEAVTEEGHKVRVDGSGHRVTELADGSTVEEFSDGRRIQIRPSGERLEVFADGRKRTVFTDGSEIFERSDGSRYEKHTDGVEIETYPDGRQVQRNPDGVVLEHLPDGREVQTDRDGNRVETYPDGRRIQSDPEGNRAEILTDGTLVRTYADGFRYWGSVEDGLVTLTDPPDRAEPGSDLVLTGAVAEGLVGISAGLIRMPAGAVHSSVIEFSGRGFTCTFAGDQQPDKPGHYRIQIQAYLAERSAMAVDRPLIVGMPEPLGKLVVTVLPYRSPEQSANRVLGLIDKARTRAGAAPLQYDKGLNREAEDILWRGVAGGSAENAASRRRGQNLGKGNSVEEIHTYMVMNAPQRRIMLNSAWRRVGVAVEMREGEIRVAQVFE